MVEQLKRLLASRFRISTQLYLAMGGAVVLTLAASLVGWFSFNQVGAVQSQVNEGSVPELAAAFGVAQYSGNLVAAAPNLTVAATPEEFDQVVRSIDAAYASFEEQMATLEMGNAERARVLRIRERADTIIANIEAIETETSGVFDLIARREALQLELTEVRAQLDDALAPAIDDQLFYALTGYRNLSAPPAPREQHLSEEQFVRYRRLAELQADVNIATELLANAFTLPDASLIEPLRERFESTASRIDRNLSALVGSSFYIEAVPIFDRLFALGSGEDSVFGVFAAELRIAERQAELLGLNRDLSVELVAEVNGLVGAAQASTEEATEASTQAIFTGRVLLLAIIAISITGALLITWLFIGRVLLRRIGMLSQWMRDMAQGDLEVRADIGGRDEVAEMAAALDVFRRHALEVQRLNLVEELAEELQGKNDELEDVLSQLQQAQDQIVMREKLAALGELTAGVAHEIRNPLNFVNNFSEASGELVEELKEILEEEGVELDEEQRDLVEEITGDLTSNVERIRSHGERANRIVQDMLSMGRGSQEWQTTDINGLVDQHALLAYHSARATNPDFQLDIQREFDPNTGELEVIPQDLGRVFLNLVSNACHATNERRVASAADGGPYHPMLTLITRREDSEVQICIRDNGTGIPEDVIEKIFNPFFTTKPTDQGTGLGLAISADIVRRHGGHISVQSEPGEFTEMTIALPLQRPPEPDPTALAAHPGFE
ncbi:MAG: HAMP domain-containing protein [Chloroflexi bacterium]|nr:HAMP domain-containing protein [Chloroflexota bacterium]